MVVPKNLSPGSILSNTDITLMEPEKLSFYTSGFTLQLLNNELSTSSSTFDLALSYVKNKAAVILKLRPTANLNAQNQFNMIVSLQLLFFSFYFFLLFS